MSHMGLLRCTQDLILASIEKPWGANEQLDEHAVGGRTVLYYERGTDFVEPFGTDLGDGTLLLPVGPTPSHPEGTSFQTPTALVLEANCNLGKSRAMFKYIKSELQKDRATPLILFSVRRIHADDLFATCQSYFGDLAPMLKCYKQRAKGVSATRHCETATQLVLSPETCAFGVLGKDLSRFKGGIMCLEEDHTFCTSLGQDQDGTVTKPQDVVDTFTNSVIAIV